VASDHIPDEQPILQVLLLLHSPRDAIKIQHALASGEIYLGAPKKNSFESDDEDMSNKSGSHSAILPDTRDVFRLECYGLTAADVYAVRPVQT
jgi:hypothetical protein